MASTVEVYLRGLATFKAGDYKNARKDFEALHAIKPFEWTFYLAQCELKLDNKESALGYFEQSIKYNTDACLYIGDLNKDADYYLLGANLHNAACAYKYGIHLYPTDPKRAFAFFKKAVQKPNVYRGDAFYTLGMCLLKSPRLQDYLEAIKCMVNASKDDSEYAADFLQTVAIWAETNIEKPDSTSLTPYQSALAMYHDAEPQDALKELKSHVAKDNGPLANYTRGMILLASGDPVDAFKLLVKAAAANYDKAVAAFEHFQSLF